MKYIDAEKLKTEIINRMMSVNLEELGNFGCHRVWAYNDVKDIVSSLQQEQPEVDLEEEVHNYLKTHHLHIKDGGRVVFDNDDSPNFMCDVRDIARHFYELGLNARKEE